MQHCLPSLKPLHGHILAIKAGRTAGQKLAKIRILPKFWSTLLYDLIVQPLIRLYIFSCLFTFSVVYFLLIYVVCLRFSTVYLLFSAVCCVLAVYLLFVSCLFSFQLNGRFRLRKMKFARTKT